MKHTRPGFRLKHFEVYNWGTFDQHVWTLNLDGDNTLLTGDIGSGKSTLVDGLTTLLVPSQKITYNKAAGAEAKERSPRSYALGYYKSERGDSGASGKPVALRDHRSYSVLLGRFCNEELQQDVTLAQVFWSKEAQGPPARLYVVADTALSIAEHFSNFGTDIDGLRKRVRKLPHVELHDSFPPYGAAYRRRFGIEHEQALDLFYQTVSMKSVGNLTEFVREHMLESFPVEPRIAALITHFEDLTRAHEAVVKARHQVERLSPLVTDCGRYAELLEQIDVLRGSRDALRPWFAALKRELLEKRLAHLDAELIKIAGEMEALRERQGDQAKKRDSLRQAISEHGGDRIERIKQDIAEKDAERQRRSLQEEKYNRLAESAGLPAVSDAAAFLANQSMIGVERDRSETLQAEAHNAFTEVAFELRQRNEEHKSLVDDITSLKQRRSNIPRPMVVIRQQLCDALNITEEMVPFSGELIQVRADARDWEGAIERLMHGFGQSLLVPDALYARVSAWVDRTHLRGRLRYYQVKEHVAGPSGAQRRTLHPQSLVHKVAIQPNSPFYRWLDAEVARQFDYACCDRMDDFRREERAVTPSGQVKNRGGRHEKDDRYAINDRTRYVLGWSNEGKIAALEKQAQDITTRGLALQEQVETLERQRLALKNRVEKLQQLAVFDNYRDLDWTPLAVDIHRLEEEQRQLEESSNVLKTLQGQLEHVNTELASTEQELKVRERTQWDAEQKLARSRDQRSECDGLLAATPDDVRSAAFPRLQAMRDDALGVHTLTVESCDNRERDMREWLQVRIDAEDKKAARLRDKIIEAMRAYHDAYPLETREVDVNIDAAEEYRVMLDRLSSDDLPRFELRFKELLNENTIREVANFQSHLMRERETIKERIHRINQSLHDIQYNPGRYIVLDAEHNTDTELRDFQHDLRSCTEGALTGSGDDAYSEVKFLQVQRIIERFKGRTGSAELDKRWTRKVTDVRNWYTFSASERWHDDDAEYEHYTDSGGKSGGQKEKLAYTVLAASLAYQFGLETGANRSFRFVMIDEAFGRGSDESARYGLELFQRLGLQLLVVTPLQKIHIIEPYVAGVGFVYNPTGRLSELRNLTIEEYRQQRHAHATHEVVALDAGLAGDRGDDDRDGEGNDARDDEIAPDV